MASTVDSLTFDCHDPRAVAGFWCTAMAYEVAEIDDEGAELRDPRGGGWPILFLVVPEAKAVKNRLHLDLRPPRSMAEEVDRLRRAGASIVRRVDEGGSFWTVMQDPEGNEFCVLRGPEDGWEPS